MKAPAILLACALTGPLAACGGNETPVESAVEKTKDALDMREHEKIKDAAEDMGDALDDAAKAVKEEAGRE